MKLLSLLIFYDPDTLEQFWSDILYDVSQVGFFWCVLMISLRLCIIGKNTPHVIIYLLFKVVMMFLYELMFK